MDSNPISAVEAVAFIIIMLAVVKLAVDALEAAPIGFNSEADDVIEDAYDDATGVWEEVS